MATLRFIFVLLLCVPLVYLALRLAYNLADRVIKGNESNRKQKR